MARRRHQAPAPFVHGNWWVINYREDVYEEGQLRRVQKQKQLAPAGTNKRHVLQLRDEFLAPLNHGSIRPSSAVTFNDFVKFVYRRHKLPLLEGSSQSRYESVLDNYLMPAFETKMLRELTYDAVQSVFTRLSTEPQKIVRGKEEDMRVLTLETRRKIWTVFSSVMEHARKGGHVHKNPAEGIDLGRGLVGTQVQHFVTPKQFALLLETLSEPYATMIYVAAFTGLRVSELAGLRWRNIDGRLLTIEQKFCRGHWGAPKSNASNASIIVGNTVIERIFAMRGTKVSVKAGTGTRVFEVVKRGGPDDLVFEGVWRGGPLNDGNVLRRHIKPAGVRLGIPWVNWLCLRRSTATWHKRAGTHVKDAQRLMRHEHAETMLKHYAQIEYETQVEAVDRFEQYFQKEVQQVVN